MMKKAMSGKQVEAARLRLGMTQSEFGQRLGVSERTISRWERLGCSQIAKQAIGNLS